MQLAFVRGVCGTNTCSVLCLLLSYPCHASRLPPLLRHTLPIPPLLPCSPAWCFALQNVVMRLPWVFAESWVWTLMVSQRWFQAGRQMSQRRCRVFAGGCFAWDALTQALFCAQ